MEEQRFWGLSIIVYQCCSCHYHFYQSRNFLKIVNFYQKSYFILYLKSFYDSEYPDVNINLVKRSHISFYMSPRNYFCTTLGKKSLYNLSSTFSRKCFKNSQLFSKIFPQNYFDIFLHLQIRLKLQYFSQNNLEVSSQFFFDSFKISKKFIE